MDKGHARHGRAIALSVVGFGLLALLIWWANPARVLATLRNADPAWIGLGLVAVVVAALLGAVNSYIIAVPERGIRFPRYLAAYWMAWALGQVVPGQVGDLIAMSVYLRRRGLALPTAVGRLGVDKLISLFCSFVLSAGLVLVFAQPVPRLAGAFGAGLALVLLASFAFVRRWPSAETTGGTWRAKVVGGLRAAHHVAVTHPWIVALDAALSMLKLWVIGGGYWCILRALHAGGSSLATVTIIANSAGLIAYLPLSANGIGTVEAGALYLFGIVGKAAPLVLAMYLIMRFAGLALAWGGAVVVLLVGVWRRSVSR